MKTLDRKYERFSGGPTKPPAERVHVTLSYKGRILLNRNAYRLLREPEAVFLYFNRTNDTIAIEPTRPKLPGAFPVLPKPSYWVVNASPFCRHFGIKLTTTEKFIQPEIEGGNLILKLNETVTVSGMRKSRKRRPETRQ
jgi:hypothetical protein